MILSINVSVSIRLGERGSGGELCLNDPIKYYEKASLTLWAKWAANQGPHKSWLITELNNQILLFGFLKFVWI